MSIDALVAPLLRLEIFQGLRPLQITEIARQAERVVFKDGQVIVHSGTPGDAAYVLVSGDAVCRRRNASRAATEAVETGSMVGELAMLIEHEYAVTVVAKSTVRALKITRESMHDQMRDDVRLAEHLSAKITERLKRLSAELRRVDNALVHASTV
jgi:CRP-like cAMP-binding protein